MCPEHLVYANWFQLARGGTKTTANLLLIGGTKTERDTAGEQR